MVMRYSFRESEDYYLRLNPNYKGREEIPPMQTERNVDPKGPGNLAAFVAAIFMALLVLSVTIGTSTTSAAIQSGKAMGYYGSESYHRPDGSEGTVFFAPWTSKEEVLEQFNQLKQGPSAPTNY
jgi:hypothetical protein